MEKEKNLVFNLSCFILFLIATLTPIIFDSSPASATRYDYQVPYIKQLDYSYPNVDKSESIGESACAPTSLAMLLQYYYPNSGIDVPEVYHSGIQGYGYHGPAAGYKNVSFQPPDPGLDIVDEQFRSFYSGDYSGLASPEAAAYYLKYIWGGESYGGEALFNEKVINEIKKRPLILNIRYNNNPAWGHYVLLRGYDDGGTPGNYSDDKFYVNDPYTNWPGRPDGENREFDYAILSSWYKGRIINFEPTLSQEQRKHTVVVDNAHVQLDDIDAKDADGSYIWWEYYGPGHGSRRGDWYYPKKDRHWARWSPNLLVDGIYKIYVIFRKDQKQSNVNYVIYKRSGEPIRTVTINQKGEGWLTVNLGTFFLKKGSYVQIDNVPAQCNVDAIRFEYIGPFNILKPTQSAPVNAGPKDNPNKIEVEVQISIHGLNRNDFNVQIGGKNASIISAVELSDKYVLEVMPPTQDANDLYDLTVTVDSASDTEIDAIRYSEAANIDVPLVIDRSGSMTGSKIEDAKNAAKQFVDFMSNGDQVGVVSFNEDATVNSPLTLITSSNVKQQVKSVIDSLSAGGWTSIGDGLQFGQDQLTSNGISEHTWAIILLSDGLENRPAWVADVLPGIPEKTDVYTIALGYDADEALMQDIATETGGRYYFSPSPGQLQEIYSLIRGQIAAEETIISKPGTVNEGEIKIETANIDSTISQATFGVNWSGSDIDLTLTDPNGLVIDPDVASTDPNISFSFGSTYEYYTIDSPASGGWQLNIEGVDTPWGGEYYTARVTGKSDLTLSAYFDKDRYEASQPITVLISLSDASGPITRASVEVVVQAPSQSLSAWKSVKGDTVPTTPLRESVSTLKSLYKTSSNAKSPGQQSSNSPVFYLYDDGAHGDGQANDGIYGNLYTSTSNSGSYIFNFEASGTTNRGDSFTRITQRSLFVAQATATGSISGTISYSGSQTGTIYIQSWQGDPTMYGNPDYLTSISSPGSYVLSNLPDSTHYLASYMDSNENGIRDENEPRGVYGPPHMPSSVIVSGGSQTSDVDITIIEGVISYPNPCYLNRGQTVKIANLPLNSKVYIYTISGELLRTLDDASEISTGGSSTTAFWDCKNDAGQEVARGIYIYLATDNVGSKKTGKIAIIK